MKSCIYCVIILVSVLSCSSNQDKLDVMSYSINDFNLEKNKLSDFFEVTHVDPINEGTVDFISEVHKVKYYDSLIYILDRFSDKKISVYNSLTGKFEYNIGFNGEGPGGFDFPYDFYIDDVNGLIKVLTVGKILNYKISTGEYLGQELIEFPATRFTKIKNGNWLFILGGGSPFQVIITDESYKTLKSHMPRFRIHNMLPWEAILTTQNKETLIVRNFDNSIYKVNDNNEIEPFVKLEFGDQALTDEEKLSVQNSRDVNRLFGDRALLRRNFYLTKSHCLFVYQKEGKYILVVKNLKSGEYVSFDGLDTDNDLLLEEDNKFPLVIGMDFNGNFITRIRSNIKINDSGHFEIDNSRASEALTLIRFKPTF